MIAIVGAGVTGLALAHALAESATDCIVFEAADRPGGVIRTVHHGGHILEDGPQRTRLTPPLRALIASLSLESRLVLAPDDLPLRIYSRGRLRLAPFDRAGLLRTDLLSAAQKFRLLLEPLASAANSDETVAAFLARRFGRAAYERLLGPLFGGLYASDPADMLVRHALAPTLRDMGVRRSLLFAFLGRRAGGGTAPAVSFGKGLGTLTDALAARAATKLHLGARVTELRDESDAIRIAVHGLGDLRVDHVVLTTPADEAAGLLRAAAPHAAVRLASLRYNPLAVVHLRARRAPPAGLGYQVAFGEPLRTRGVTFNDSLFGRSGIHTAFLGGARDPDIVGEGDASIGGIAAEELERVTGCDPEVLRVTRTRVPAWDRSWTALEGLALPPRVHLCANYESRIGIPGRIAAAAAIARRLAR